jgi:diguanylate cyclase (GGDEF)-like protein/PAS domain S-box-containing protein
MKYIQKKFNIIDKLISLLSCFQIKASSLPHLISFRICLVYVLSGLIWIYYSDTLLEQLVSNQNQFTYYSIYKGWVYIGITALLLYFLVFKNLEKHFEIKSSFNDSEDRWKFALEGAGDGVWDWNLETDEVYRSARWSEIFGYSSNEIERTATAGRQLIHPKDLANHLHDMQTYLKGQSEIYMSEFRLLCKDGTWKWILSRGMIISRNKDGNPLRVIGTHTDISQRKSDETKMFQLAHYDQLTNLPNRFLFLDRFQQLLKSKRRKFKYITLMYLDLDHFKEVNDTFGHDVGDLLLKEAAKRILKCVRADDTVARMGGDEFTVILNNLENQTVTERVAQSILKKLAEPFNLNEKLFYISTSIGISVYPNDGGEVDILLKNADQAMYAAKDLGRNRFHYFTSSMQEDALKRMHLNNDLRSAISENQFVLYYQPIVDLNSGNIQKAEALIRWQHPERGLVSPLEFIPIAEDTGLIIEIGDWVFREAVNQITHWRAKKPNLQISVNRSPVQFRLGHSQQLNWIKHLQDLSLPGDNICIEITEGLLLDARDNVINLLEDFRDAGIQLSIDDFGTGYSSLGYLRKFNIDYVKIDKSFTSNIYEGSSDLVLCEAIIVMAHKLGKKVVAEGIETQEQLKLLVSAGCDFGQGYLFSRPIPTIEFEGMMMQNFKQIVTS